MVCDVLVELAHVFIDKTFTYHVPDDKVVCLKKGVRVVVPFGGQFLEGFVLKIYQVDSYSNFKDIISVLDKDVVLNEELLELGKYIQKMTLSTLMSAYQAMLPLALKAKNKVKMQPSYEKFIRLNLDFDLSSVKFNEQQQKIIDILKKEVIVKREYLNLISVSSVKTLLKKGILILEEQERYRLKEEHSVKKDFVLSVKQQEVFDRVASCFDVYKTFLLYGVTGSGKTNVYMKLIERVIANGKSAIVLVPEISLTPQTIMRFRMMFDRIAVLHSNLSDGEKYDEWRKIREGKVDIVIGARSAIFAPLTNLGIIIVDEEHSSTYKQENNPRYHAIDVAKWRANYHNCPLVLGSATPMIDDYARASKGVYELLSLNERFNQSMPNIKLIDMNKEFKKANGYLSNILVEAIKDRLSKNEQVILFLNRRGYANFVTCSSCGEVMKCPNCDISLTYHKSSNMLRCHYCGYATKKQDICSCGGKFVTFGLGTEKVKEELEQLIPDIRVVRMDVDTTTKKNAHEKILQDFQNEKYQLLVGTQMIAKGLDFPNVTLVGVINADISLNFPDFRASEVTFQLLSQVSGRSGRGSKKGEVLIQTFNPTHYALKYTLNNDYFGFYQEEMKMRKKLCYPPYYYLCSIKIVSSNYDDASKASGMIGQYLKEHIKGALILGPSIANPFRINNKYRFQIILKYKDVNTIYEWIAQVQEHYFKHKSVKLEIDFNPIKL